MLDRAVVMVVVVVMAVLFGAVLGVEVSEVLVSTLYPSVND